MKRIFFYLLIIILSIGVAYDILSTWRGVHLLKLNPSERLYSKALQLAPLNPDPFYALGLFYEWDIRNMDQKKSIYYLHQAIDRNPLEQSYWINLAKVHQRIGEKNAFEKDLEKAILVFPTSYQGRWVAGNLFLQEGALDKALPHFSYILKHYPEQSSLVYDVLSKVVDDPDFIFEKLVPEEPAYLGQYLSYLYEMGDSESAKKVWKKKISMGYQTERSEALRHIEFLIAQGEINEAYEIWKARLQEEGSSISSDGNLITNGSFEKEKILGGGFDWKISNVPGAKVSFDQSVAFEGKSSLKITFDGKENVDFYHLSQLVSLKPNTDYLLKAYMRTKAVTTKSGIKIEVYGMGPAFYGASVVLIGDNDWKQLNVAFRTPAQSQAGVVRVRREKTDKFDRLISGKVWLDNVQLTELKH
jgi:tetratricopeptide (TPR) repeat protein